MIVEQTPRRPKAYVARNHERDSFEVRRDDTNEVLRTITDEELYRCAADPQRYLMFAAEYEQPDLDCATAWMRVPYLTLST